jgi:hypothetical protein
MRLTNAGCDRGDFEGSRHCTLLYRPEFLQVFRRAFLPAPRPGSWPALVLNADFRPLSYYPLSIWSWQDTIKAVFLDRVNTVAHYDKAVRSPTAEFQLPSVVSLKSFVRPSRHPAFTRFNVFPARPFLLPVLRHAEKNSPSII